MVELGNASEERVSVGKSPGQAVRLSRDIDQDEANAPVRRTIETERRLKVRYPIELEVRIRVLGQRPRYHGVGHTVNASSGGLLIASPRSISTGTRLQLMIAWPSRLDGRIPLQLVATGVVLRSEESRFAVTLTGYEFRTRKWAPASQPRHLVLTASHQASPEL
jgi:hypothetical protein